MRLNRNELRKIQYDFNSFSNRLLQADFQDYTDVLGKFLNFINNTPIIFDYISDCGHCDWNLEDEVKQVQCSYGSKIFSTGDTEEEEVRNVYAVLQYISDKSIKVHYGIGVSYSSSNDSQDKIKGFNERFVMVLIRHIERYLTKVGIDMGLDDKITYNVTVQNGQSIIATDNASVTATNTVRSDASELAKLIADVRALSGNLSPEEQEIVSDSLEVIEAEASSDKPKKGMLRTAIAMLKNIKDVTEFGEAVIVLSEFVCTLIK
ncbi:putative uncharacterized protein [Firmicutes bacterium CAG:466]|nr:putative uncharacterized protein [Firmicutes bacterium CAG:466]